MDIQQFENHDFWQTVLDTVTEGLVVIDAEGAVRHLNLYAASTLGISRAKARKRHFREVFCPSLPEEKCWVNYALQIRERIEQHHFDMEQSDGSRRKLVANFTPIKNSTDFLGALISLRKEEDELPTRWEQEKHRAILGSLAEGLFTVDNEWRITSFNRAAERITGWKEQDVLGKHCKQVFASDHCIEGCPLAETLRRSKPLMDFEVEYRTRHGEKLPVYVNTAILYNSQSEAMGGVISFRDCSVPKQVNEEMSSTRFQGIVGKNKRMMEVYQLIQEVADGKATVLILGESGTGKELVAKALQNLSHRKNKPFIRVNCAAIPDSLIESELFGHVKGAFTDAYTDRIGRFELADGGTIFLDEVGDITPSAQLRLLRVIEEGEFQRLGSSETMRVDVRVIAATNRDLWQMVQQDKFRDDLYYRLNVIPIHLPPLRERRDDLPFLVEHFMEKYRHLTGKPITEITDKAYDLLMAYNYPGNVRELENIIEHAFARTKGSTVTENKLPLYLRTPDAMPHSIPQVETQNESDEGSRILQALQRHHWNREAAAQELDMSRTTLWRRMRELDLVSEK